MSNDELAKIRQEIKESVLPEDLEQHLKLYGEDINLPSYVQQEGWDEPAYDRDEAEASYWAEHGERPPREVRHPDPELEAAAERGGPWGMASLSGDITSAADVFSDNPYETSLAGRALPSTDLSSRLQGGLPAGGMTGDVGGDISGRGSSQMTRLSPNTRDDGLGDAYGRTLQSMGTFEPPSEVSLPPRRMTTHRGTKGVPGHVEDYGKDLQSSDPGAFTAAGGWKEVGKLDPTRVPGYRGADLPVAVQGFGHTLGKEDPGAFTAVGGMGELGRRFQQGDIDVSQIPPGSRDVAYKGDDTKLWDDLTGMASEEAYNRPDDMWESKSATVRGWIIENFKPLRSDGYDPKRIVKVLNERPEKELIPTMINWFHENKKQLQKDGYDFDLVVDKLNED